MINLKVSFKTFFEKANLNPNAHLIKGTICGYRIEEIDNPLTKQIRYLDKLVDELAKGKKMEKILRQLFLKYDSIITPAAPGQAPRDLMNTGNAIFNGYWTMMGVPAISLPFLKGRDNLPIGIRFIANWSEDLKLLEICKEVLKKEKLAD